MGITFTDITDALKQNHLFASLSEEHVKTLALITRVRHFDANELIFTEGQEATAFFQILKGKIQIYRISREGKTVILRLFGEGDIFAEVPFFNDFPFYPANAMCLEPSVVLAIDGPSFLSMVKTQPEVLLRILGQLSKRLHEFNHLIGDLSLRNVDSRLAKYLLSVSENTSNKAIVHVNRKTLAAILGTVPETLSRSLKRLIQENLIETTGDKDITLLNREALIELANID